MPKLQWRRPGSLVAGAVLAALGFAGCTTFDEQQRKWIFQPATETWWAGADALNGSTEAWIEFNSQETSRPAKLHAVWYDGPRADAPVLLYLHGARWDVSGSARRMQRMTELGFAVLGVDYRGFGKSGGGLPSERMAYEDAREAWKWLAQREPTRQRFIFGHSLGGAVAVNLATEVEDAAGLIVEGGFTSIADVASTFKWGWLPFSALITQRFEAASKIERVKSPVLVVHGSDDRLIPPSLGRALFEKAPTPKRFVLVDGGSHHNTNAVGQTHYQAALRDLFGI
jgi:alpha-beta hydrolase superfamily lysophospholipase